MTLVRISFFHLWRRRLTTVLNVALLAFAIAAVTLLVLTTAQIEERIERDARGIDLVVGPAGSQTQLILSAIHGLDAPAGTLPWNEAQAIASHRAVRNAYPLVFGDTYQGFRIVGTKPGYLAHYGAKLREGQVWREPMEAVFGANVAARLRPAIGSTFTAFHAVPGARGEPHSPPFYRVAGVLERTGTVLDGLILTDVASYWTLHPESQRGSADDLVAEPPADSGRSINALLIQYDVSHAAAELPYVIAGYPGLQAVSATREAAPLRDVVSIALDLMRGFAVVLLVCAALSVFIALYHGLTGRRYDVAVMRTLGATRGDVMALLVFEGVMLAAAGAVIGLALGHVLTSAFGFALREAQQISITGFTWYAEEAWILLLALVLGFLTALMPAWRAHEVDIATTLARG